MPLLPYSEEQVLDRLRFENPGWASGEVEDYTSMQRRLHFDLFMPLVREECIPTPNPCLPTTSL